MAIVACAGNHLKPSVSSHTNRPMISGSYKSLLRMLEEAFEAGFSAGFHSEDNPADFTEDWEEYKKEIEENL